MSEWHSFATAPAACAALAAQAEAALREALMVRGHATLGVSGGTSPLPFFHALRSADIDWSQVTITLADDRQVGEESPLSNAALVRRELLQEHAAAAHFVPLNLEARVPLPFDMLVLGMGKDAHTASLFPHQPMEGGIIISVVPDPLPPEAPVARYSFSCASLRAARQTALLISGAAKRAVLEDALANPDPAAKPVSAVLSNPTHPIHIFWSET